MKWSNVFWIVVVIVLAILAIGYYTEQMNRREYVQSEAFQYDNTVEKCHEKIKESCKELYPSQLEGMTEEEIQKRPEFTLYKDCVEMAATITC